MTYEDVPQSFLLLQSQPFFLRPASFFLFSFALFLSSKDLALFLLLLVFLTCDFIVNLLLAALSLLIFCIYSRLRNNRAVLATGWLVKTNTAQ